MEHRTRNCETRPEHIARYTYSLHRDRNQHLDTATPTGTTSYRGSQHMERFHITNLGGYTREVLSTTEKPQIMHWYTVDSKTPTGNMETGTLNLVNQKQEATQQSHRAATTSTLHPKSH